MAGGPSKTVITSRVVEDDVRTLRAGAAPFVQVTVFHVPPAALTSGSPPFTPMMPSKP
jgi:hypothetical protein